MFDITVGVAFAMLISGHIFFWTSKLAIRHAARVVARRPNYRRMDAKGIGDQPLSLWPRFVKR